MIRTFGAWVVTSVLAIGCGGGFDEEDGPLGCELPEPCALATLPEQGLELDSRAAAECIYDVLVSGEDAHLQVELIPTSETYWDIYIRGDEPAVVVSQRCEYDGPCEEPEARRCTWDAPEHLDCSNEDGPPRVCGSPVDWCNTSSAIEPTCP